MMLSRLKFDLQEIAEEMLDMIDPSVFEREDGVFLDPAMAGGQLLKAVEERLRSKGNSDSVISKRVSGYSPNQIVTNFAKNRNKLLATVETKDFTEPSSVFNKERNMKFDVVIANPPFTLATKRDDGNLTNRSGVREFLNFAMDVSEEVIFIAPCHFCAPVQRDSSAWKKIRNRMNDFGVVEIRPFDQKKHFPSVSFANAGIIHLRKGAEGKLEQFDDLFGEDVKFDAKEYLDTQRGTSKGTYPEHKNGKTKVVVRMKNDGSEEHEVVYTNSELRKVQSPWFVAVQEQSGASGIKSAIVFDNTKNDTAIASNIHPLYATSKEDAEKLAEWVTSEKFNEMFMQVTRGERVVRGGWLKKLPKGEEHVVQS